MAKSVAFGLILLAALILMLSLFQSRIIFPTHAVGRAGPLPAGSKRLTIDTADGYRLHGVSIPSSQRAGKPRTMVLGFAGNAWNSADAAVYLHQIYPQAHVVAFHYRGYAPSTGSPSAEALLEDAPNVFDAAVRQVRPERTVAVGFSVGSAIAASLADRRPVDGLILVTPFDSLKAVASSHYPWLPVGFVFSHELDAARHLGNSDVPTAILAAERDSLIPPARTDALRRRAPNLVFDRTIAGAGHNDIYHRPDFHQAMRESLEAVTS